MISTDTPSGAPIGVWRFADAPRWTQALSPHGGDEDWLAILPRGQERPDWMREGTAFGVCRVSEHALGDGRVVVIGAHS